jgi:hypothetical protein
VAECGAIDFASVDCACSDASARKQILVGSILKHLCALVVLDAGGLIAVTPAFAAENPVRWTTGGSVWSTSSRPLTP